MISDTALIKGLFSTSSDLVGVVGGGSTFGLDGEEHLKRRKLLAPPFHGKQIRSYEAIIEDEVMRESRDGRSAASSRRSSRSSG